MYIMLDSKATGVEHASVILFYQSLLHTLLKVFLFRCNSAEKSGKRKTEVLPYWSVGCLQACERILSLSRPAEKTVQKGLGLVPGMTRPMGTLWALSTTYVGGTSLRPRRFLNSSANSARRWLFFLHGDPISWILYCCNLVSALSEGLHCAL